MAENEGGFPGGAGGFGAGAGAGGGGGFNPNAPIQDPFHMNWLGNAHLWHQQEEEEEEEEEEDPQTVINELEGLDIGDYQSAGG